MDRQPRDWYLLPHDPSAIEQLARRLGVSPILAQLLLNRQLHEPEAARRFLDAPLKGLHAPELLPGVTKAADLLQAAIQEQKRITVYGDYDVDGTTGTAVLWQVLRMMGAQADFYVPHRLEEGYGLNKLALQQLAERGAKVVVTVDCGIAAVEEAVEARRLGLELIITDHHEFKATLPDAQVLVHPRLPGASYPFGGLSGAGVAFKLTWALAQRACGSEKVTPKYRDFLLDGVALTAMGLVADAVPLQDENRIFVRHGLNRLREAPLPGIKALLDVTKLNEKSAVTAEDVSFKLAPRLNAVGRLGSARLVVELLTTTSHPRAVDLARVLEGQNSQRQQVERKMLAQAREMIRDFDLEQTPALILAHAEWHPGILGIVASRLVDLHHRPVLLIALQEVRGEGGMLIGHGSGRSIRGYALNEALDACGMHLVSHGGHPAAAGFRIRPEAIDTFRDAFCAHASRHMANGREVPRLTLDAEIPLTALTPKLVESIDRMEPFGMENRRPLFLATHLQVTGTPRLVGAGERHLSFQVRQGNTTMRTIAFNMADRLESLLSDGGNCCVVYSPKFSEWQGYRRIDLEVIDLRPGAEAQLI